MPDAPSTPSSRLDALLAAQLGCSRTLARQYIEAGHVRADGVVIEDPQAEVGGVRLVLADDARIDPVEPATLLVNKPRGMPAMDAVALLVPEARFGQDGDGQRLLSRHLRHLDAPMPIEAEATGLLVLTQDGRVRRRLLEDFASLEQEYVVEIRGDPGPYGLQRLARGLEHAGRVMPPCKVSWQNEDRLRLAMKGVQPDQLRTMCAAIGLDAVEVRRLRIGRVGLAKMPVGQWRMLPTGEKF